MADIETVKKGCEVCIETNCADCPYNSGDMDCMNGIFKDALEAIESLEKKVEDQQERIDIMAADAPVHCKDCRHYDEFTESCNDGIDGIVTPEFYCANAEPKEADDDADTSDQA